MILSKKFNLKSFIFWLKKRKENKQIKTTFKLINKFPKIKLKGKKKNNTLTTSSWMLILLKFSILINLMPTYLIRDSYQPFFAVK